MTSQHGFFPLSSKPITMRFGNTRGMFFKHPGHELSSRWARTYEVKFVLSSSSARAQDVLKNTPVLVHSLKSSSVKHDQYLERIFRSTVVSVLLLTLEVGWIWLAVSYTGCWLCVNTELAIWQCRLGVHRTCVVLNNPWHRTCFRCHHWVSRMRIK